MTRGADPREMFEVLPWPFPDGRFPASLGAVIMRTVLEGRLPALQVVHTPDNGWAIGDGVNDPNEPGACVATHIRHVLGSDPTLEELARLPPGTEAKREDVGSAWQIIPFEWTD